MRPETQYALEKSPRVMSLIPRVRNAVRGQSGDRGTLGRGTGGTVDDACWDLFWWLSAGDVFFRKADCGARKDFAHIFKICSALAECGVTLRMVGTKRVIASRPRASLGCAIVVAAIPALK